MYLLNEKNEPFDPIFVPDNVYTYYWVYDAREGYKDYYCAPVIEHETYSSPTIQLELESIGRTPEIIKVNLPAAYQLLIGESSHDMVELNPLTSLSGRGFKAFQMNPLTGFRAEFWRVDVSDVLPMIHWSLPMIRPGQLLCVPITSKPHSPCIYIAPQNHPRSLEVIPRREVS